MSEDDFLSWKPHAGFAEAWNEISKRSLKKEFWLRLGTDKQTTTERTTRRVL